MKAKANTKSERPMVKMTGAEFDAIVNGKNGGLAALAADGPVNLEVTFAARRKGEAPTTLRYYKTQGTR